jgi:uncharacterized sporulation protein YeaH/YhbH (DUF444 family)
MTHPARWGRSKSIERSFFFWMGRFLKRQYEKIEIVFIAHHTEAKEVTEEEFFTRGESGSTICSSAYVKALEIIDSRYPSEFYNIYPFHFSDGDNGGHLIRPHDATMSSCLPRSCTKNHV